MSAVTRAIEAIQRVTAARLALSEAEAEAARARAALASEWAQLRRDPAELAALLGEDLVRP